MQQRRALGRGLDALIPSAEEEIESRILIPPSPEDISADRIRRLPIDSIVPNRLQPRKYFDKEKIAELSSSIKEQGIIQPLIVTQVSTGKYELVAGERRLRAAKEAGLTEVPAIIKNIDTEGLLEISLIENIQREDLNPIEEAGAIRELIEQFGYTQDEAAAKLGKSRTAVANSLRLLNLPKVIQDDIVSGRMSAGHARALLALNNLQDQLKLRERILNAELTVRDIEKMIHSFRSRPQRGAKNWDAELTPQMKFIIDEITKSLATKVRLECGRTKKGGRIIIEYYSVQDLDRIYNAIVKIVPFAPST